MSICWVPSAMLTTKYTLMSGTNMVSVHSVAFGCENVECSTLFGLKQERPAQALQASLRQPSEPSSSHIVPNPGSPSSHPGVNWASSFSWYLEVKVISPQRLSHSVALCSWVRYFISLLICKIRLLLPISQGYCNVQLNEQCLENSKSSVSASNCHSRLTSSPVLAPHTAWGLGRVTFLSYVSYNLPCLPLSPCSNPMREPWAPIGRGDLPFLHWLLKALSPGASHGPMCHWEKPCPLLSLGPKSFDSVIWNPFKSFAPFFPTRFEWPCSCRSPLICMLDRQMDECGTDRGGIQGTGWHSTWNNLSVIFNSMTSSESQWTHWPPPSPDSAACHCWLRTQGTQKQNKHQGTAWFSYDVTTLSSNHTIPSKSHSIPSISQQCQDGICSWILQLGLYMLMIFSSLETLALTLQMSLVVLTLYSRNYISFFLFRQGFFMLLCLSWNSIYSEWKWDMTASRYVCLRRRDIYIYISERTDLKRSRLNSAMIGEGEVKDKRGREERGAREKGREDKRGAKGQEAKSTCSKW